jgi:hypothetical protein
MNDYLPPEPPANERDRDLGPPGLPIRTMLLGLAILVLCAMVFR